VAAIHSDRVDRLQSGDTLTPFVAEGHVAPDFLARASRLDTTKHRAFCQRLILAPAGPSSISGRGTARGSPWPPVSCKCSPPGQLSPSGRPSPVPVRRLRPLAQRRASSRAETSESPGRECRRERRAASASRPTPAFCAGQRGRHRPPGGTTRSFAAASRTLAVARGLHPPRRGRRSDDSSPDPASRFEPFVAGVAWARVRSRSCSRARAPVALLGRTTTRGAPGSPTFVAAASTVPLLRYTDYYLL
jgi:hypothetical protein